MTHWGWYWWVKRKHRRKATCSRFIAIDSFEMFRSKEGVKACRNGIIYEIPQFQLKAFLLSNDNYRIEYRGGVYGIAVEKQACNFGGFRYFFHCPHCDGRMRILYCNEGIFLCRKCLNLCYFTQLLRPPERCLIMAGKVEKKIQDMAGSLQRKPPRMALKTYVALKVKYREYSETKYFMAKTKELVELYPHIAHLFEIWQ